MIPFAIWANESNSLFDLLIMLSMWCMILISGVLLGGATSSGGVTGEGNSGIYPFYLVVF